MSNDIPLGDLDFVRSPRRATQQHSFSGGISLKQLAIAIAWTFLADVTLFRALGFSGPAVFFAVVPVFFLLRELKVLHHAKKRTALVIVVGLLWCVATRLVWSGSALNVFSGVILVGALGMTVAGYLPRVMEGVVYMLLAGFDGAMVIAGQGGKLAPGGPTTTEKIPTAELVSRVRLRTGFKSANWLFPVIAALVFGSIFVFANPDLLGVVSGWASSAWSYTWDWIGGISAWEIPFCIIAFVLGVGLLWPALPMPKFGPDVSAVNVTQDQASSMYTAYRNTLLTLITLFTVYLCFEFATLWWREFPKGFYYAGYAHQGAAWLTFALALATGLLSLVFRGEVLRDQRLDVLRRLSWTWSGLNFVLAIAVYNRLMIYVGYNGMTRMRTVGFFGITLVVVGFALVLIKIAKNRGFWWLVRTQLIAFVLTIIAYGLFPVDWVAHHYNASQVQNGHLYPAVMIAVKPMDDTAVGSMIKLTSTSDPMSDPIVREGVLAMLAQRQAKMESDRRKDKWHWSRFQIASSHLYKQLVANQSRWQDYLDQPKARHRAITDFKEHAMQWY